MLSFLTLERKQKNSSNAYRIRIFLFRSYSFGIETITTFIHSRSSLENHSRFQTKMGKVYTRFQTKTAQRNPTGTYLDSLYKGVPQIRIQRARTTAGANREPRKSTAKYNCTSVFLFHSKCIPGSIFGGWTRTYFSNSWYYNLIIFFNYEIHFKVYNIINVHRHCVAMCGLCS